MTNCTKNQMDKIWLLLCHSHIELMLWLRKYSLQTKPNPVAGVNILQQNRKLFPDKNDQKQVTFHNLLSKLSKKDKLFPDGYPQIM